MGSANVIVRLASPIALVVGAGGASGAHFVLNGEHRFVTAGLRVTPWRSSPSTPVSAGPQPPIDETVRTFWVERARAGAYRLTLEAPLAHSVELSGDFTNWRPVLLLRRAHGAWSITLPLAPGTYRVNARVDGGRWIVPPGLTKITDDFAGEVGLLVIESARGIEGTSQ